MSDKVLVAMSGGVDSAVAALLLREQGYEVCGATMKLFDNEALGLEVQSTCCSLEDVEDARRVCVKLDCPHYVFNFGVPFEREVMRRFADEYRCGRTPNPCIDCNRFIKFPLFLRRAEDVGARYIATGHYARTEQDPVTGRWLLLRSELRDKDQSYVLYAMTQEELARTLFPLGTLSKAEVRAIALQHGLRVADKPDSQDICFVPDGDYATFLTETMKLEPKPGKVLDTAGNVLGTHDGVYRFTVGQRKHLPVNLGRRVYVVGVDAEAATVTLGGESDLHGADFLVEQVNWISVPGLTQALEVTVQTRYRQREVPATLTPAPGGLVRVHLHEAQRAITPGQSAVFYDGPLVVGGGIIRQT